MHVDYNNLKFLRDFERDLKRNRFPQSDLEFFNHGNVNIDKLVSKCTIPTIITWCDNWDSKHIGWSNPVLGCMLRMPNRLNIVFVDRLLQILLTKSELYFLVGHEVGHAIENNDKNEFLADEWGASVSSWDTGMLLLRRLSTVSDALNAKYGLCIQLDKDDLEARILAMNMRKLYGSLRRSE